MPQVTYDRFEAGLDRRKGRAHSDANRLWEMKNAHVTTGWRIRKRPGTTEHINLANQAQKGLFAYGGELNTFGAPIGVADPNVAYHEVPHPTGASTPERVLHAVIYEGFIYVVVQFFNGDVYHYYLDEDPQWEATTAYTLGDFREPTTRNGLRYEVTTAGTSDSGEPTWPTTVGATVADGTAVWTCRSKVVEDANCPHSKAVTVAGGKIFALGAAGSGVVRFCATGDARDWTAGGDAGFLPVANHARGSTEPTAIGRYRKQLLVCFADVSQTWTVDPDPANHAIDDVLDVGTIYHRALVNIGEDVFLLTPAGLRSISSIDINDNLSDSDAGSPIDTLVKATIAAGVDPDEVVGAYLRGLGQAWWALGTTVYVFTYSRTAKLTAWSRYMFPWTVRDIAEINAVTYLRYGLLSAGLDRIAKVDAAVYVDARDTLNGEPVGFEVDVETTFQAMKKPGQLKTIFGMDVVMEGTCEVSHRWNTNETTLETVPVELTGDTRPDGLVPVELQATEVATRFVQTAAEAWELHLLTLYYDVGGPL